MSRPASLPWLEGPGPGLRVWAVEPFLGGSHRDFALSLAAHSAHAVEVHGLPGRHWSWRMQGGALALAERAWARPPQGPPEGPPPGAPQAPPQGPPQVIFAGSMLDLPLYKALVPPAVAAAPCVVYFHENQLTYPLPPGKSRDLGYGWKNLTTALVAQTVLFNSAFHRQQFLEAVPELLSRLPDCVPEGLVEEVAGKSSVLPLGCDLARFDPYRGCGDEWGDPSLGPLVLWNQRWEYDKGPELVAQALLELAREGRRFRVAIAGAGHGRPPAALQGAKDALGDRVVQFGKVRPFERYARLLWAADVVVSAARHEFFGQAVVEAMYCGCRPVLPRRLSYPELIPAEAAGDVLYPGQDMVPLLRRAVEKGREWSEDWQRTWVARYDWGCMAPLYDRVIWQVWEES